MVNAPPRSDSSPELTADARRVRDEFRLNAIRESPQTVGTWRRGRVANLQALLARPELRPLAGGVSFRLNQGGMSPYALGGGHLISLHPSIVDRPDAASAVVVRHALELAILERLLPGDDDARMAALAIASRVTSEYLGGLTSSERDAALVAPGDWLEYLLVPDTVDPSALLSHLTTHAAALFALRPWTASEALQRFRTPALRERVLDRLATLLPLAFPTERLLTLGGDSRLPIDPATGLNRYGCSPKPRPWANTFSSCTATSVSEIGFNAAERCRQRLVAAAHLDGFEEAILDHSESIRRAILHQLRLDIPGTELVLTSSGTDAELLALYVAAGASEAPLANVVLAPTEVGSGTVPAAAGRHFDTLTPLGGPVRPGAPVRGLASERVELLEIPVRRDDGTLVATSELDTAIEATVRARCAAGGLVLLHLVDSSKTGVGAPSVALARRLAAEFPEQLTIVVDAAQMRVSRPALRHYLDAGFLLLITGSKFFTGPPFSGGLVLPPSVASRVDHLPPLPAGLADYTSRSDFPLRWRGLTRDIPLSANIGSLLRWRAALWEMEAFYAVPPPRQFAAVRHFVQGLAGAVAGSSWMEMVDAPALNRLPDTAEQEWDSTQTIFSLLVRRPAGPSGEPDYLTLDEARRLYHWLNADLSPFLADHRESLEHRIASSRCHVGQPVVIFSRNDRRYAAIRIAFGARLVSRVEMDPLLGESAAARREWELGSALAVLRKIEFIARHWAALCTWDDAHPGWLLPAVGGVY